jgi:hypothetical protein
MTQQQGIVKGDALQKIGSAGFIVAAVLVAVGNTYVASLDLSNPTVAQERMSGQIVIFQAVVLLILFGWWALLIGAAAVQRSIMAAGAAWARVGLFFMIMGTILWTLGIVLDIAYSDLIAKWTAAPAASKESAYNVLMTLFPPGAGLGRGLFPITLMCSWLAFAFLGIGMIHSAIYPRWLGWLGSILGILGVLLGIVMTFTGREAFFMLFTVLAFVSILWLLMSGIWMARRAW